MSLEDVFELSSIDRWFLVQIQDLVAEENRLQRRSLDSLDRNELFRLKQKGFSDHRLASLLNDEESVVRALRHELG